MSAEGGLLRAVSGAEALATKTGDALLAKFAPLLLADAPAADFEGLTSSDLRDWAQDRLSFAGQRRLGRAKIGVSNQGGLALIDIVNDDMPFLVDSTLALLNELQIDIRRFLHPVIAVKRGVDGKLLDVEAKTSALPGYVRESFLHAAVKAPPAGLDADALAAALESALAEVRMAVLDWRTMIARAKEAIQAWQTNPPPLPIDELTESIAFLHWLLDNHFTFLGVREYAFGGADAQGSLDPVPGSGLGILRQPHLDLLRRGGEQVTMTPEIREFFMQPAPLVITKSDLKSQVHRRVLTDYIGLKLFDNQGALTGELRLAGLFTSSAYTQNPNDVPLVRRKIKAVIGASGYDPGSHSGKALASVLETYPRDELFQIDTATLGDTAAGILKLEERPRTRLFIRRDRFDRFVSAFVFIARDRFNSEVRSRAGELIAKAFAGRVTSFEPSFGESSLVRVHYIIERLGERDPAPDLGALESAIVDIVRTWEDRLDEALPVRAPHLPAAEIARFRSAFPAAYRDSTSLDQAIADLTEFARLKGEGEVGIRFVRMAGDAAHRCHARLYRRGAAIPLSSRLPIFEAMGFRSIAETTHELKDGQAVVHDVLLERADGQAFDVAAAAQQLEEAFLAVWTGQAENDVFNALVLREDLPWTDAAILRAFARYLRQAAATYTPDYIAQTMVKHGSVAAKLVGAFHATFDPNRPNGARAAVLKGEIADALTGIASLDEDRIVRRYLNLLESILRTNFYQRDESGARRPTIAFKIDSKTIEELPAPKPFAEIFVYSPDVEGVHLRGGPVARGGLRWSDRPEDFRTEVLGLAKAQGVKNAVIVPVGAKGGFVPKKLPVGGTREAIQAEGTRAYKLFVSSLLDLTDNISGDKVVPSALTVRRDKDDPYLVVAADKGTAAFSDIANSLSAGHGFWLDDAFASGGSAGYDHKKMAITARGAWEAVKRHFREAGIDVQTTPFSVIGVGDMSGDVFGNGMLLSKAIRLIAAFDHRDIFVDPAPDPAISFAERERLFALPRSSWQDYDKKLISAGGGVFPRTLKAVPLSLEMRRLTGIERESAPPLDIIAALLRAPCDLLWFGGIGTYIKAPSEGHGDAGDRANDAIRADSQEVRAKVIGEGANLGVTQKGRITYALAGGRINTDAVDNSAGVNSSDIEVNIKIALGAAEARGKLTRPERNQLLASMTGEVAGLVLRNNYLQTLCLSVALAQGTEENGFAIELMHQLEARGMLDRKLESLPSDLAVIERDAQGGSVTRPEWAVLMAYAKLALNEDLRASGVPDDPFFAAELVRYFPAAMQSAYAAQIKAHRLRREIVATMLSNGIINRGGPSFVARLASETGRSAAEIAAAFAVARDSFGFGELNRLVEALDGKIAGSVQNGLYVDLQKYLRWSTVWFLRHESPHEGIAATVAKYRAGIEAIAKSLSELLTEAANATLKARAASLVTLGVPAPSADRLSMQRALQRAPDAVRIAAQTKTKVEAVASALFASADALAIDRLAGEAGRLVARDLVERRAINRLTSQLFQTHRLILMRIVTEAKNWDDWRRTNNLALARAIAAIEDLAADKNFDLARLAVAQGALADLAQA